MNRFGLVGISHRRASVGEIGRVSQALNVKHLKTDLGLCELLCLSTCNRIEFYWSSSTGRLAEDVLSDLGQALFSDEQDDLAMFRSVAYSLRGEAVIKHLFSVLSGLDSLVLGDDQILGQFRKSLAESRANGDCGQWLGLLGDESIKAARRVRRDIDFSKRPTSLSEVAAHQLKAHRRKSKRSLRVVLIGSGEMVQATAARLKGWQGVELCFVNRSIEGATQLAALYGGKSCSLEAFQQAPQDFDAMVVATAAPGFVVTANQFDALPEQDQPRLLIDLGVPLNIDPALGKRSGFTLFDIQELGQHAKAGRREAELLVRKSRPMLRQSLSGFRESMFRRSISPLASRMRKDVELRASSELEKYLAGPLAHLGPADHEIIGNLVGRLTSQTIQVPLLALRKSFRQLPHGEQILESLRSDLGQDAVE